MSSLTLWVTAGRGPRECMRAVVLVAREIAREADEAGLSAAAGLPERAEEARSVAVTVSGEGHQAFAGNWEGTVMWTARSPRRGKQARKNWFVAVKAAPAMPEPPLLDPSEVRFGTMQAGGPGGQHQNATESAVRAVHIPTGVTAVARSERSQHRNRAAALERLRHALASMHEADAAAAERKAWLDLIQVERGSPRRTYAGDPMSRTGGV